MNKKVLVLRIAFWLGIVLDGVNVPIMLSPRLGEIFFKVPATAATPAYRFAMAFGAALMLGWTVLLFWADRKPVARRGIALLTIAPVVLGLAASFVYGVSMGLFPLSSVAGILILQSVLSVLYIVSFVITRDCPAEA